jgi:hypothetical protein
MYDLSIELVGRDLTGDRREEDEEGGVDAIGLRVCVQDC